MTTTEVQPSGNAGEPVALSEILELDHNATAGDIKPGYDPRLTNNDLAPLKRQRWGTYNIFAFWMSDVHSVGGYPSTDVGLPAGSTGRYVMVMHGNTANYLSLAEVQVFAS